MEPVALYRPADENDRRDVRHVCGYGCVRCGATIFQYRATGGGDAVDDIVLLCPACAHALTGAPGAQRALTAMRANPLARQKLFDRRKLPYGIGQPDITFAGVLMRTTPVPILFGGHAVMRFGPPEVSGGAIGMSILLGRAGGEPEPLVVANEWTGARGWTFERPANRYVITSTDRSAQLILAINTPQSFTVELLRTHGGGRMLEVDAGGTRVDGVFHETPVTKKPELVGMSV